MLAQPSWRRPRGVPEPRYWGPECGAAVDIAADVLALRLIRVLAASALRLGRLLGLAAVVLRRIGYEQEHWLGLITGSNLKANAASY